MRFQKKKLKKLILPLTFVVGVLSYPLGKMAVGQVKKAYSAMFASETPQRRSVRSAPGKRSYARSKHGKKSSYKSAHRSSRKNRHLAH